MRAARVDEDVAGREKIISGATTVYVNNRTLALEGSTTASGAVVVGGSTTVFAENRQVARKADGISNGQNITTGSSDVFVNQPND
jgi:uncharacterized Zn-binding protein involved in type VI secretion